MRLLFLLAALTLATPGCSDSGPLDSSRVLAGVEVLSGDGQSGPAGQTLAEPVRARALRLNGTHHETATVYAMIVSGAGALETGGSRAFGNGGTAQGGGGIIEAEWTLGDEPGEQRLRVFVIAITDTISVDVTATATGG